MRLRALLVSISTYGKANDKVITNFGFGLIIGFTLLVIALSDAQNQLEKRKTRK